MSVKFGGVEMQPGTLLPLCSSLWLNGRHTIFGEIVPGSGGLDVVRKIARMPADGLVLAKEAFRLVEQLQAYQGEEVLSYMFHAYGTNLQFDEGEFNFVKARAEHGTRRAFELRDEHFEVPEP